MKTKSNAKLCIKKFDLTITELASLCDVTRATVAKWFKNNDIIVPAKYCPKVRLKTGVALTECNPQVFTEEWVDFETKNWSK
jgi:DNA-binding XRE family transcriptional regulator